MGKFILLIVVFLSTFQYFFLKQIENKYYKIYEN